MWYETPEYEEELLSCVSDQEVVAYPSLDLFESHLDTVLFPGMALLEQGGWTRAPTVVPSNLTNLIPTIQPDSVILLTILPV